MKKPFWFALGAAAAALLAACADMDMDFTPEGNPNRVLTGTVDFRQTIVLPPDAVVVVRVLGIVPPNPQAAAGLLGQAPVPGSQPLVPQVLGEQTIKNTAAPPIPFRVEYSASDDQLRAGLNIEARVSYGGSVRWFNVNSYSVNLNNVNDAHAVSVDPAGR